MKNTKPEINNNKKRIEELKKLKEFLMSPEKKN